MATQNGTTVPQGSAQNAGQPFAEDKGKGKAAATQDEAPQDTAMDEDDDEEDDDEDGDEVSSSANEWACPFPRGP